jgi:hypothetical protein
MLRGSQPGALLRRVWRSIAQTSRTRRAIRFGFRLWKGAANLEAVVARNESLNEWYGRTIAVERATAGPPFAGKMSIRCINQLVPMFQDISP